MVKKILRIFIILILVGGVGGGGYYYYRYVYLPSKSQPVAAKTMQTAIVRTGNITLSVTGVGYVIPAQTYALSFKEDGNVKAINVEVGSKLEKGDLIAELEEEDTTETLTSLKSALQNAKTNLLSAQIDLENLFKNADMAKAEAQKALVTAEQNLAELKKERSYMDYARCSQNSIDKAYASYLLAKQTYEDRQIEFDTHYKQLPETDLRRANAQTSLSAALDTYRSAYASWQYCINKATEAEIAAKDAEIQVAEATLKEAQDLVDRLGDGGLDENEVMLYQQRVANAQAAVEEAQYNLDQFQDPNNYRFLYAPASGIVTNVAISVGQKVASSSTVITMINMDQIVLEFYIDETDLANIAVGMPVKVTFDALPSDVFTAKVTKIYPELSSQGNTDYVKGLLVLDPESIGPSKNILIGMNAGVEIINGESTDTLLIPVEALRELDTNEYAVFKVENGTPRLIPVTVGLKDVTYVEITSGLSRGDIVSTGITETN